MKHFFKEMDPICHPSNCQLPENATECKTHYSPQELELTETFCEKCKTGSLHITPTIVPRRVCRNNIRGIILITDYLGKLTNIMSTQNIRIFHN